VIVPSTCEPAAREGDASVEPGGLLRVTAVEAATVADGTVAAGDMEAGATEGDAPAHATSASASASGRRSVERRRNGMVGSPCGVGSTP
jgi:hypothetical protein